MIRYLRVYFLCDNATSLPLMIFCMQKAFAGFDIELKPSDINAYRGLEKRDAIKQMLEKHGNSEAVTVDLVFERFKKELLAQVPLIKGEIKGTSAVFQELTDSGIAIALCRSG
eukprot:m.142739 g.142739  ORF g.142739 m.142739 type:complete len:113 (+) comp24191_c0_seq20:70-408(+)